MRRFGIMVALIITAGLHGGAIAQQRPRDVAPPIPARVALPAAVSTEQTLALPGRTLRFTATADSIPLLNDQGQPMAAMAVIAYQLDSAERQARPVTFVVNGGPGYSSAWLQLGGLGPWRLPMSGAADAPSASPELQPNAETWLDFTDLVFLDPAGTGYSRIEATGDDARKQFWSVDGDITSLSETIGKWLERNHRLGSPKYIAGESYGGFRGPRLVRALAESWGVGIAGLVLISPALDMASGSQVSDPLAWAERLPTEVAIARAAHGPVTRESLADAETYAGGDYLLDLVRGQADDAAMARISQHVAALTGLDPTLVRQHAGQIDPYTFRREIDRAAGRIISPYDGTVTMPDPFPNGGYPRLMDPLVDALQAPFSAAMTMLYDERLHWHPDARYLLLNEAAARGWDFGRGGRPQAMSALRQSLALDPHFRAVVMAGLFDQVVPYFRTQVLLNTIPKSAGGDRVRFVALPGGHMIYARDDGRVALRNEAEHLIDGQ